MTWHVQLMPLKFLSSDGSGYTSDAVDAITYATAMGARVMSNSWGGGAYSQALKDAIDAANGAGILFVVAAGNDGQDTDVNPTYPACFTSANIISVAATDDTDKLASFSNYGTATVQIAAPGVGILSTFPTVATAAMNSEGLPPNYGQISGTSMATPLVSGAAALALAQNPSLNVAQLRNQLIQRVDTLTQLAGVVQSAGRLDLHNVVNPSWSAGAAEPEVSSVIFDDTEGNDDGIANPGEIIHFTPTIFNAGGVAATNVTAVLNSNQGTATVLTGAINTGSLSPFAQVKPGPLRVQLSSSLADNTTLTFDLVVTADGLTAIHTPASVVVSKHQGSSEAVVSFTCGEIKADPARNLVYLIDATNDRVDAIDTGLGQETASTLLDTTPGPNPPAAGQPNQVGQMAISLDGTRLYVALPTQQEIEVFSLPGLSQVATLSVNFSPVSLATGVSGRLFASSTDGWGQLREVNPSNGATVTSFGKGGNQSFYEGTLLRTNIAGTRLYAAESGIFGSAETIYPFDISSGGETLLTTYSCAMANVVDFGIDELENRIYTVNTGVYGLGVTDMTTGSYSTVWPFGSSYAAGVTFLPNDTVIYGASGDPYNGNIRKFNRTDGTPLGDYVVGRNGTPIRQRGIAITPNGEILYVRVNGTTSYIGLIGGTPITITNPPPPPPTPAAITLATVPFSDTEGNGDGVANPGEIIDLTPTFKNIGGTAGTNVSISLATATGATLLTPAGGAQALGTVAPGATVPVPAPYRIQLAPGLADGTAINFTFTATWDTGQSQQFVYTQVVHTTVAISQLASSLQYGDILADQQRDFVYLVDKRYLRLLVFNTDLGAIVQTVPLGGLTTFNSVPPPPGMMAESVDGSKLFIALPQSQIIQEFSLPDMTSLAQWSYSFQPESLATDALGRLYCTTNDATQKLVQIDTMAGAILTQSGPAFVSTASVYFDEVLPAILHRNAGGTELYGSLGNQIYRFSTTGGGAPIAINTLASTSGASIFDYALNEQAACFYVAGSTGVCVVPLSGAAATAWSPANTSTLAVSYLPGTNYVSSGFTEDNTGTEAVGLHKYSAADGSTLTDYIESDTDQIDDNTEMATRGLATTPNGRTVFIAKVYNDESGNGSVDSYDYFVGMIGGSVSLDIPPGTPVGALGIVMTDPAPGSNDGFAHAGQTVQVLPTFKNFTSSLMSSVSVTLVSNDPLAIVQSPATSVIGNVASFVDFTPTAPFKVAISSAAPDGYELKLAFQVNYNNGTQQLIPYSLFAVNPVRAQAPVSFNVGAMLADRTRDLAYVIDNTNNRVLAIDTDLGVVSKAANLASSPGIGQMAVSYDGSRLYVALTAAQQIQVFHLPDLSQLDIINVNFQPSVLAAAADGNIYASEINGYESYGYLHEVDPATGQNVGSFGRRTYISSSSGGGPDISVSSDGASLYVVQTGIEGDDYIDQYAVSTTGLPTFTQPYPFLTGGPVQIDDQNNRVYSTGGGIYGLDVTDLTSGIADTFWPFGTPYGGAVAFLPQSNFVYGGSVGPYDSKIRRFNRSTGAPLEDFVLATGIYPYPALVTNGVVITANGHIVYLLSSYASKSGYILGVIGCSSLTISPPTASPAVYAGSDITTHLSQGAALSATVTDSVANVPVTWTVVGGPGGASINSTSTTGSTISFASLGVYQIQGTAKQGSLTGSDLINVTVLPDPAAVSVTATVPTAVDRLSNGQLTFTRTGQPSGALAVTYTVSGTARSGVDYTALPSSVMIPDGASTITVPIVPMANGTADSTVVTDLASSASYSVGVSQEAVVTLRVEASYTTFGSWATGELTSYALPLQAPTANPAKDGIPNLLKYALNLNPTQNATQGLPVIGNSGPISGQDYLTISFTELQNATDLAYTVQVSSDLMTWSSGASATTQVSSTSNDDGTSTVVVRDLTPLTGNTHRFIRLQVSRVSD